MYTHIFTNTHIYTQIFTNTHIYTHRYSQTHTSIHTDRCVYIHIHIYVHNHAHIHIHSCAQYNKLKLLHNALCTRADVDDNIYTLQWGLRTRAKEFMAATLIMQNCFE